jgi:uncharacterized protein (DUF983 family)
MNRTGKCPRCGASIGIETLLSTPPNRPFRCNGCGGEIQLNSDRAILIVGGGVVVAILLISKLELASSWLLASIPIVLAVYVLFAKVDKVGE